MARYYNPDNGLFLSIDPVTGDLINTITLNGHNYNNNPVMYVDPNGHFSVAGTLLFVPGVGQAVLLVGGVVLLGGLAIYAGSQVYKQVQAKASSDYNTAKLIGSKTINHSK